jgi:SET domain
MATPQPPLIRSTHLLSNILPSNRVALVNDGCSIHGTSLVANVPFRRGDLILPLIGRLSVRSYRTIQIDGSTHLDGDLMAFMNHSCRPTSIVQVQAMGVRAAVDLKQGDEITFFYPSTEWDMVRPFECLCGADDCVGFVAGAQYLSTDILRRYFINPHIQELFGETLIRCRSLSEQA